MGGLVLPLSSAGVHVSLPRSSPSVLMEPSTAWHLAHFVVRCDTVTCLLPLQLRRCPHLFCGGKMQEEHYVSKLHVSWPQVSCVSRFSARGTRAVIVCCRYKFALRISTLCETEAFMSTLKGILKSETETEPLSIGFGSAIASQSEFMSSNTTFCRAFQDSSLLTPAPVLDYTPELPAISNIKAEKQMFFPETESIHKFESNFEAFPPSFTSLLTEYCPIDEQDAAADLTNCDDVHLKSQIAIC